eukprot:9234602-Pyramimonas_sp.AAC.3
MTKAGDGVTERQSDRVDWVRGHRTFQTAQAIVTHPYGDASSNRNGVLDPHRLQVSHRKSHVGRSTPRNRTSYSKTLIRAFRERRSGLARRLPQRLHGIEASRLHGVGEVFLVAAAVQQGASLRAKVSMP